jgi:hypothetical protein
MMTEQQDRTFFHLYTYAKFFWEKKKVFLLITIPFLLIGLVVGFLQGNKYEATATFSVDNTEESLMDPDLVKANYSAFLPEELKDNFQVFVPKYKKIKFQLVGTDQKQVETLFRQISDQYYRDLLKMYQAKEEIYNRYQANLETKVEKLSQTVEMLRKRGNNANSEELRMLIDSEKELAVEQQELETFKLEMLNFTNSKPKYVEPIKIEKKPSPLLANLILAGMFGFLVSVLVLVLWKYVQDAKAAMQTKE